MSTPEIESAKIDLKTTKKLNGWWRLWIVLSCIWLLFVASYSTAKWFKDGLNKEIPKHYQIYQKLDSTNKLMVFESEKQSNGKNPRIVEIPNADDLIYFKSEIEESKMLEFTRMYYKLVKSIQFKMRSESILIKSIQLIIPPIIIAALGKSIAWIIKGFKS